MSFDCFPFLPAGEMAALYGESPTLEWFIAVIVACARGERRGSLVDGTLVEGTPGIPSWLPISWEGAQASMGAFLR